MIFKNPINIFSPIRKENGKTIIGRKEKNLAELWEDFKAMQAEQPILPPGQITLPTERQFENEINKQLNEYEH